MDTNYDAAGVFVCDTSAKHRFYSISILHGKKLVQFNNFHQFVHKILRLSMLAVAGIPGPAACTSNANPGPNSHHEVVAEEFELGRCCDFDLNHNHRIVFCPFQV